MKTLLLFVILCQNIVIITDDDKPSQHLLRDLNHSWCDRQTCEEEDMRYLEYIREKIVEHSVIVDFKEIDKREKLRVPIPDKFPAFRIHPTGHLEYFDDDAIYEDSFAMLMLKNKIDLYYNVDLEYKYRRKRNLAISKAEVDYERDIIQYVSDMNLEFVYKPPDIESYELDIEYYKLNYSNDDFFPVYIEPNISAKIVLPQPWHESYTYTPFANLKLVEQLQDKKRKRK